MKIILQSRVSNYKIILGTAPFKAYDDTKPQGRKSFYLSPC